MTLSYFKNNETSRDLFISYFRKNAKRYKIFKIKHVYSRYLKEILISTLVKNNLHKHPFVQQMKPKLIITFEHISIAKIIFTLQFFLILVATFNLLSLKNTFKLITVCWYATFVCIHGLKQITIHYWMFAPFFFLTNNIRGNLLSCLKKNLQNFRNALDTRIATRLIHSVFVYPCIKPYLERIKLNKTGRVIDNSVPLCIEPIYLLSSIKPITQD